MTKKKQSKKRTLNMEKLWIVFYISQILLIVSFWMMIVNFHGQSRTKMQVKIVETVVIKKDGIESIGEINVHEVLNVMVEITDVEETTVVISEEISITTMDKDGGNKDHNFPLSCYNFSRFAIYFFKALTLRNLKCT